jgi:hypothetical protein
LFSYRNGLVSGQWNTEKSAALGSGVWFLAVVYVDRVRAGVRFLAVVYVDRIRSLPCCISSCLSRLVHQLAALFLQTYVHHIWNRLPGWHHYRCASSSSLSGSNTHLFSKRTVASLGSGIRKKVRGFWAVVYDSWQWCTILGSGVRGQDPSRGGVLGSGVRGQDQSRVGGELGGGLHRRWAESEQVGWGARRWSMWAGS